jgi:transposase
MPGPRTPRVIELSPEERSELERLTRSQTVAAGLARRARIILLAAAGMPLGQIATRVGVDRNTVRARLDRFGQERLPGLADRPRPGRPPLFTLAVILCLVRLACELPRQRGRSLSLWTCTERARQLVREGVVATISSRTVHRLLAARRLKPWRWRYWLHPKGPRDAEFLRRTREVAELTTRELAPHEVVLSTDEMTSIQPRPRPAPTRPAQPGRAAQLEHEYARKGARTLFAAFNTRTAQVIGACCARKRQVEFIALLERLLTAFDASITTIHLICDNVSVHRGKQVRAWLAQHPRIALHFLPVHSSWMNQVEQWFSILRRKRLKCQDFADLPELTAAIEQFIAEWNQAGQPFNWTAASFEKVLAKAEAEIASATSATTVARADLAA